MSKTVKFELDLTNPPPLTDRQKAELELEALKTLPVDSDVLMWLKSKGKGYQTRINAILRDAMLKELK